MDKKGNVSDDLRQAISSNGMVASARFEATNIGVEILKSGGNAVDAAVAVGFALGVCEPNASGLGGGGFMNVKMADSDQTVFLDFREVAPMNAKPSMWNFDQEINPKSEGGKSVCTPGEVAGLTYAHEKWGTLSLKEVMQPAINLAEEGVLVTNGFMKDLVGCRDKMKRYEQSGNVFLKDCSVGESLKNPFLANSLKCVAAEGRDGFYKGKIAEKLVDSVIKHDGVMTQADLDEYNVQILDPIVGKYKGYEIQSSPLPSSGGTHIIQILNILEQTDIHKYPVNSKEYIHILSEILKMCFADRQKYMGDPNFCDVPTEGLISKKYAKRLAEKIDMTKAQSYCHDYPVDDEPTDTTHFSIVDDRGNMVSCTKTISAFFGSGIVAEDTGIVLNCQTRGFAKAEGKSNSVGPRKKPLSSMSPTIVTKDGKPFAVLGSPGGNRIIPTVVQIIIKLIDYDMSMEEAINSPRISNDMTEKLLCEGRIEDFVIDELKTMGHETEKFLDYDRKFGGVQGILIKEKNELEGAADPRRDGVAIGY